jgi:HK97 family phage major capsid protein
MLKVLLLRKKIDAAKKALEDLRAKDADFAKREAELEAAIEEAAAAEGEDAAEAQKAVEEEVEKFDQEKAGHEEAKKSLTDEITELENDLATEEASQETAPAQNPEPEKEERKVKTMSVTRNKFFAGKDVTAMFEREDVKAYLAEIRSCIKNKRELTNVGLTIPEVFVGLIKENVENYSKLYKHVNVQPIAGKAREIVQGTVAEAIWTECCAVLNELSLAFNDVEIDCYKVAGYYKVCNAVLEDNDVDLATKLLEALSQAIGLAVDKAILYGRNSASTQKMPLGIVSRLAQTSEPSNYPTTARPWVDLHTSNIISLSAGLTGAALFKQLVLASGKAKSNYSRGEKVWVMNETTYTKLVAETVSVDANGRVVTGVAGTMPVIGGVIEVLNFIPDNTIIGGYFDLYMLGERAGAQFAQSEHVFFIQDQTAFKGTARYDGQPVIAEAFVAIGLEATTPAANAVAFAPDTANVVTGIVLNADAVTVDVDETFQLIAKTLPIDGDVTFTSSDDTKATVSSTGLITGKASGSATITAVSGSASASVAVTVTT